MVSAQAKLVCAKSYGPKPQQEEFAGGKNNRFKILVASEACYYKI